MPQSELHLWPGRAVYRGLGFASLKHRHQAIQLGLSLGEDFLIGSGEKVSWSGFWVTHNFPHEVGASGTEMVSVWTESGGLRRLFENQPGLHQLGQTARERLSQRFRADLSELSAVGLDRDVAAVLGSAWTPPATDKRVQAALTALQDRHFTAEQKTMADLAADLNLSSSRLRHLFRDQVGMSLQSYRLWQRLFTALRFSGEGMSLTEAAHAAGFSDSSHLSRVFKRSFGIKPSGVLNSRYVQVIVHD